MKITVFCTIKKLSISIILLTLTASSYSQESIPLCTDRNMPYYSFVRMSSEPRVINALPFDSKIKEEQHWEHFNNTLDKHAFIQLKNLITNLHKNINYINHIIKMNDEEYLISIDFPYMAKGFYQVRLPVNLSESPWISESKLVFASKIVEILKSEKSGLWLLVKGGGMRHGRGYDEFSLVSLQNPKQSMILINGESVSEEIDLKEAKQKYDIDKVLQEIEYEITAEGKIKFNVVETDSQTGLDSSLSYVVEESNEGIKICYSKTS